MKKLFLTLFTAAFCLFNAQISKGTWMLVGTTGLNFNTANARVKVNGQQVGDTQKTTTFTFNPTVNYFIIDNLAVGFGLGFNSSKTGAYKNNTFTIMPEANYFFPSPGSLKPFVGAGIGYASNTVKYDNSNLTSNGLAWKVNGGVAYLFNSNVALILGLQYLNTSMAEKSSADTKSITSNLNVGAGIAVFLHQD